MARRGPAWRWTGRLRPRAREPRDVAMRSCLDARRRVRSPTSENRNSIKSARPREVTLARQSDEIVFLLPATAGPGKLTSMCQPVSPGHRLGNRREHAPRFHAERQRPRHTSWSTRHAAGHVGGPRNGNSPYCRARRRDASSSGIAGRRAGHATGWRGLAASCRERRRRSDQCSLMTARFARR